MKKEKIIFCIFISIYVIISIGTVPAYGISQENNLQILKTIIINGHTINLVFENVVIGREPYGCFDSRAGHLGFYPVTYSKQYVYLSIDGIKYSDIIGRPYIDIPFYQFDNWEHCFNLPSGSRYYPGGNGEINVEHFLELVGDFRQENGQLKIDVRHLGGFCSPDSYSNCRNGRIMPGTTYYQSSDSPYNFVETLSVPLEIGYSQCNPQSGMSCCEPNGRFSSSTKLCRSETITEFCNIGNCGRGIRVRAINQFCSGTSARCEGTVNLGEWSDCRIPLIEPEECNGWDDNCDGQVDEGGVCQCGNGRDDDRDGLIDLEDPGCSNDLDDNEFDGSTQCQDYIFGNDDVWRFLDNDNDEAANYPTDFSCENRLDNNETNPQSQCQDVIDNDNDGKIDFPVDTDCISLQDNSEGLVTQCNDGIDNDNDGAIDYKEDGSGDLACNSPLADAEFDMYTLYSQERCEQQGFFWNLNKGCCGDDTNIEARGQSGQWESDEITCDNKDNDCDGFIDEINANGDNPCPLRCGDGTLENICSSTKPYYCEAVPPSAERSEYAVLVSDPERCGCPDGTVRNENTCFEQIGDPPNIVSFIHSPSSVSPRQSVTFKVFVIHTDSPLLSVQLFTRRYPLGTAYDDISRNSNDYTEQVLVPFNFVDTNMYNYLGQSQSAGLPGLNYELADLYEGIFPSGFNNEGFYVFKIRITDQAGRVLEYLFGGYVLFVLNPSAEKCTTLHESGDPNQKMNIFFISDVGDEANKEMYQVITSTVPGRLRSISPIPENNLQDKFNLYRNNYYSDLHCFDGIHFIPCGIPEMVSSALACNKPVKLSIFPDANILSDKIVAFREPAFPAGINYIGVFQQFVHIFYDPLSEGYPGPFPLNENWADIALHELGHSFGLYHTNQYETIPYGCLTAPITLPNVCINLGCDAPRDTIMGLGYCPDNEELHRKYSSTINNRLTCPRRNDIPEGFPLPWPYPCLDNFSSDTEYLVENLRRIP